MDGRARRERWLAVGLSLACHAVVLQALLAVRAGAPLEPESPVVTVSLVQAPAEIPRPAQAAAASPRPAVAKAAFVKARALHAPMQAETVATSATVAPTSAGAGSGDILSGPALGSATGADALPGGECNMARRLQGALRRDSLVRAAVVARGPLAGSAAILVWNGGWVASPGEEGRGLAAVREAIVWEVAFAPPACREGRVHGPVLFTVSDASGLARIAIGSGDFRWADLVSSH